MTQEEKQLLLQDLCARLPYYPIVHVEHDIGGFIETADLQVYGYEGKLKLLREDNETFCYIPIEECKLYLRPMSSMTEEEINEFHKLRFIHVNYGLEPLQCVLSVNEIDWLNSHHFDYRGLIEKGLAIKVTEENNPYEN